MAVNLPTILQRFRVDTSGLDGLQRSTGKIGKFLGGAVVAGAGAAAVAIGGFAAAGVKGAVDVDRGLREVVTLFGETGSEADALFQELQGGVAGLSDELGVAQSELTGGLYQAISAGVPKDNVFDFLRTATKAGIAGVTDTETAIDGISTTVNAFGLEADQAGAVADSMFAAVQGGKTTFEELSGSLYNVAPAAAAAGVSFQEVNAGIATLTASGTPTAQATTQMRAALVGLQRPSEEMDKIFQSLGHESAQVAIESEGLGFALDAVAKAADGDNGKMQKLLGSSEAVAAAQVIAGTGADKFASELERQANSAGATDDAFETMNESTSRAWDTLTTKVQNAAIMLGNELLPKINAVVGWAVDHMPAAIETVKGALSTMMATFRTIGEVVGPIIARISSLFGGGGGEGGGGLAGSISQVGKIVGQLRETFAAAFDAIVAVVTWFVELVQNMWARFGTHLLSHLRTALNAILQVVSGVLTTIKGVFDVFAGIFTGDWGRVWEGIKGIFEGVWNVILGILKAALNAVSTIIGAAVAAISLVWSGLWNTVKSVVGGALEWVWDTIKSVFTGIHNTIQGVQQAISGLIRQAWDAIVGVISRAATRLMGLIRGAWQTARDTTTTIVGGIVSFVAGIPGKIVGALGAIVSTVGGIARDVWDGFRTKTFEIVGDVIGFVREIPTKIKNALGNLSRLLLNAGKDVIRGLLDGIESMIPDVGGVMDSVTSKVRNFLPFSPAKEGPLSGFGAPDRAGARIGSMVADGIRSSRREVAAASGALAAAAKVPTGGFGGNMGSGGSYTDARTFRYEARATGSPVHVDEAELVRQLRRLETLAAPMGA